MAADLTRLADDDASAVIDEEVIADRRAGVDVDAGPRMGPLGHHPGNERHFEAVEKVRQPVDRDRLEPGIAKDYLVERPHGRVAVVGRLDIRGENAAQIGDLPEKLHRLRLPEGVEIGSVDTFLDDIRDGRQLGAVDGCLGPGRHAVAQGPADLRRQLVVETVDEVADMVGDVAEVEVLAPPVARVEDLLEVLTGSDDRLVLRQRAVPEVLDRGDVLIRLHDPPGELRELFLDAKVGSHGTRS